MLCWLKSKTHSHSFKSVAKKVQHNLLHLLLLLQKQNLATLPSNSQPFCNKKKRKKDLIWMIHIHMEGIKGGGGGRVGVGHEDDSSDGMQCIDHPYRNNNPGGICAFCLQEKLGKLVSSSFPLPIRPSTSSSSSPSFRSDIASSSTSTTRPYASSSSTITTVTATTSTAAIASSSSLPISICPTKKTGNDASTHYHEYHSRRTRLPFLLTKKKKKKSSGADIILKRSKSTATPRRGHSLVDADDEDFSPRKRNGFWSFLYLSSKSSASGNKKLNSKSFIRDGNNNNVHNTPTPRISTINNAATSNGLTAAATAKLKEKCCSGSSKSTDIVVIEEDNSPNSQTASSFERKVSRSRSVGCGSRSFSGDFFERISTGFGDCTLRRVESQREGKHKVTSATATAGGSGGAVNRGGDHNHHHCMKERVRCAGLFSGFMMTSSSSSSSSSSYWVSSSADDAAVNGKPISHSGRGKNWGWAFASPMRAFSSGKTSSKENNNRRDIIRDANDKNATPNLSAIPSLLSARG